MNQKGAVHLLFPVIILVAILLVVLGRVQTTTKFDDSEVAGVVAGNEEARVKQEIRTSDRKVKTATDEDKPKPKKEKKERKVKNESTESADETENEATSEGRSASKFPLRIDTSTNQLIMTKKGQERVLTILPAKAVANMLRAHLKKGMGPKFFQATSSATEFASDAVDSANIIVLENQISLEEINGRKIYKIPAKKRLKLFGFIPISIDFTGFVSAQSGLLIEEKESLMSRILVILSR